MTFSRREFLRVGAAASVAAGLAGRPALASLGRRAHSGFSLAMARPATAAHWTALGAFDLTHRGGGGVVEVLLWPGDAARLSSTGIPHEITVDDVLERDRGLPRIGRSSALAEQPGERGDYRLLVDYERDLHELAAARPDVARVITLPLHSRGGRNVYGVEIAEGVARPDGRPTFYVDGLHHAREWPSGEMAIMFAHDLVQGYGNDARITSLLRSLRVVVVPVVNVDGFEFSRRFPVDTDSFLSYPLQAVGFGSYWRKNRRTPTGDLGAGHAEGHLAYGVDNNRNYALGWGGAGTSDLPPDLTYPGDSPFSEPETRNVGTAVLSRTVTGVLSHHTYSDLVLRPWGDTRDDCPDEALLGALGEAMAEHNGYRNIKGIQLYPTTGTMSDWAYGAVGALSYTFEHGESFHPPYLGYVPDNYAINREPFLVLAEAAADPAHHSVIRGRTVRGGKGVEEAVRVRRPVHLETSTGEHADHFEVAITSDRDGRFSIDLGPSTPPVAASPQAYEVIVGRTSVEVVVARGESVDLGRLPA